MRFDDVIWKTSMCAVCFFLCKLKASSVSYLKTFLDRFPLDFPATADNMLSPSTGASSFGGQAATPVADSSGSPLEHRHSLSEMPTASYLSIDFRHSFHKIIYIYQFR